MIKNRTKKSKSRQKKENTKQRKINRRKLAKYKKRTRKYKRIQYGCKYKKNYMKGGGPIFQPLTGISRSLSSSMESLGNDYFGTDNEITQTSPEQKV